MREIGSGSLLCEPVECQPGGVLPGQNHSLDCYGTWQITSQRNSGVDKDVRITNCRVVMRRVSTNRSGMMRIDADAAQERTDFPNIGADYKVRAHGPARFRWQNTGNAAIFQALPFASDRAPDSTKGATCADRRDKIAFGDRYRLPLGQLCREGSEGELQASESRRQVLCTEKFQHLTVQQLGPECFARQRRNLAPIHAGGKHRADQTAGAGSSYDGWPDTSFG
jgi:hypothetical protein